MLNVPNAPIMVHFSVVQSDVNHCFHHAVRGIAFVKHVVQTLLVFLLAARYSLRVVRTENVVYARHSFSYGPWGRCGTYHL